MKSYRQVPALILLISLIVTACSRLAPQETPAPATPLPATATAPRPPTAAPTPTPVVIQGTLSIRHSWSENELPALVQIVDGFRLQYPDVYFDVLYVPAQDLRTRYEMETRSGNGPTLLLGPAEWSQELYEAGLTADLSDLLDEQLLASLNPAAVAADRQGQALVAAPYSMQGVVLFRNEEVVTVSPTNLDELIALANSSRQGEIIGAILERSPFYSAAHLEGIGGHLMDENGIPAFNSPQGLAWIELLRRFEEAGPPNYFTDEDLTLFQEGQVGWIIDGTWNLRPLAAGIGPENLAIDPWPNADKGRMAGYVIPDNIYLSAQASPEQRLAAQAFIQYLLSPEAQTVLAEAGRIPTAGGVTLSDPVMGLLVKQAAAAMTNGVPYPSNPAMSLYTLNLDLALRAIFDQNQPPEQALQTAADAIRAGLAEAQPTPTP